MDREKVTIDVKALFGETAKIEALPQYVDAALELAGRGTEVTLTGPGPVWLYLAIAHALHGRAAKLIYDSPVTGPLVILDHDPY